MCEDKNDRPITEVLEKLPSSQLGKPSVSRLGTALGALTQAGLYKIGISKVFEYNARKDAELSRNIDRLLVEFEDEKPVVTIPSEVVQPVMERLTYVTDPEISELFIKLLSAAGHQETASKAHPSFINLIDQLTPDEALMLRELKGIASLEFIEYGTRDTTPEASSATWTTALFFSRLYEISELVHPNNCELYMENLISLGLFTNREGWFVPELNDEGKNVPNSEYTRLIAKAKEKVGEVTHPLAFYSKNGILKPTNKGKLFVEIATSTTHS